MGKINITAGQDKRVEVALELAKGMNNLAEVIRELKAPAPSQISMSNININTKEGESAIDVTGDEDFEEDRSEGLDYEDDYEDYDDEDDDEEEDFCDDCMEERSYCECVEPKVNFENPHVINAISNMYNVPPSELVHGVQNAGTDDEFIIEDAGKGTDWKAFIDSQEDPEHFKVSLSSIVNRCAIRSRRYQHNRGKRK